MQILLVGLGNPGTQYERTRHNAGFRVAEMAGHKWGVSWKDWQKLGEYAKVSVCGHEVFLLKPFTYMNESGRAVSSLARFYKIAPQNCVICFDDVSLELGKIRIRKNGSAGGQKGMKSIIEQLGTQDIPRVRVGIGPKPERMDLADFVLSRFSPKEEPLLETTLTRAVEAVEMLFTSGVEKAMNAFN